LTSLRFSKQAKLLKTDEFSSVFNFRKRISAHYLVMHYLPNTQEQARLGLVVGKKTSKLAVNRNYMRRVLREFFRTQQHQISHVDLVVRVQKKFDRVNFSQIKQEFDTLLLKLIISNAKHRTQLNNQLNIVINAQYNE
jgi:ribonuclease P protein component